MKNVGNLPKRNSFNVELIKFMTETVCHPIAFGNMELDWNIRKTLVVLHFCTENKACSQVILYLFVTKLRWVILSYAQDNDDKQAILHE